MRRVSVALPAYAIVLGLFALMAYMAFKAQIEPSSDDLVVPDLFIETLSPAVRGFAFAAIAIAAIVPVAIMSIAAANLFTRNIYKEYLRPDADDRDEAQAARLVSLVVKAGALVFVVFVDTAHTIELQLLGGVWILQTLPAVILGLYVERLDLGRALLAGWAAGMLAGTALVFSDLGSAIFTVEFLGAKVSAYDGLWALESTAVTLVGTSIVRRRGLDKVVTV